MTARGADALSYDQANRLMGINFSAPSTPHASYAHDGDGKRASKTVGSIITSYVYDTNRSLPVLLEDGTRRYVWGLGLAYEVEGTSALVYHVEGLGSVRAITDSTKAIVQTYESDEFGVPITASGGSTQPFGFTGEQRDLESSFVYLRDRSYDPSIGRFVTRDRYTGSIADPRSLHRFVYVDNNPATLVDPSGRKSQALVSGFIGDGAFRQGCTDDIPDIDNEPDDDTGAWGSGDDPDWTAWDCPGIGERARGCGRSRGPANQRGPWEIIEAAHPGVKVYKDEGQIRLAFGLTRTQWRVAIHRLKEIIPDNPDIWFDMAGNAYDGRSGEELANVLQFVP